jgi:acyl dehydratase
MDEELDPLIAVVVPGGHSLQFGSVPPGESWYDPGEHMSHLLMPVAFAYEPAEQRTHVDDEPAPATMEEDPAAHGVHCCSRLPPCVSRYVPAGQLVQYDLPGLGL